MSSQKYARKVFSNLEIIINNRVKRGVLLLEKVPATTTQFNITTYGWVVGR